MDRTDWLSRLLEMIPVSGRVDNRCFLAAPWRIEYEPSPPGEIPLPCRHCGSVVLEARGEGPNGGWSPATSCC